MTSPINKNVGVVRRVSSDRATIRIRLPKGGFVEGPNEGFNVGDVVCFIVGPSGRIIRVIPKYAADLMVEIGRDPYLQAALQDEEVFDDDHRDRDGFEEDCPDCRPSAKERPDLYGREYREDAEIWTDKSPDAIGFHIPTWPED